MSFALTHEHHHAVEVTFAGSPILRYVYGADDPQSEGPKPYLHPVRTLDGHVVTNYRPHDHVWHKGIAMTCPYVNDQNFWGGPTFDRVNGYVQRDNVGAQRHARWEEMAVSDGRVQLVEHVDWITMAGEQRISERRSLEVVAGADHYSLRFATALRNDGDHDLSLGSPTTHGRPQAGYGGLFWRGPRSFADGEVLAEDGREDAEKVMGETGRWLAYLGRHDEVDATSTVLFIDEPHTPDLATHWFVRAQPFAAVSFAFAFHEERSLPRGESLQLRHRVVVADGAWSRERIEQQL